ncbi:CTP synthase [Candidatus Dojkabacteria bacterium]|uniref:CTP synthase (glutamine hydrolyzing) n=1 Tax=Candidatus Dojkabacteria bacterium TaxID=2099670 RepID=A0A955L7G0_9BACT|nr:CTP synthase [Candidatus Dojkabacteria bacterium]
MARSKTKYVFVTGGVMSSVGKGVATASLAYLLKRRGYSVTAVKYEGYLNVDSGTINPIEHGDPFLCEDGTEADMDLGTYERFLGQSMNAHNFYTFGKVLKDVLDKERSMFYEGDDVEPIPHVRDEIINEIVDAGKKDKADVVFTELGGTVGEPTNSMNAIYYEAIRKMKSMYPNDVIHIHVGYILFPDHLGEPKTKPVQISIRLLMAHGIMPDFLVVRGSGKIDSRRKELLARFSDLDTKHTIGAHDVDNIYKIPLLFNDQEFDETLIRDLGLKEKKLDRKKLEEDLAFLSHTPKGEITITIAGKYFTTGDHQLLDSYFALIEAVKHASWKQQIKVNLRYISTERIEKEGVKLLEGSDAIIVPIGWGTRGVEGKIQAITYARENKIPYLGLCYGMQLAAVEFARNVVGLKDAHTEEVKPNAKHKIVHSIPFNEKYQVIKGNGVSMRLGSYDCKVKKGTRLWDIYEKYGAWKSNKPGIASERHRHRFEFNNEYKEQLEKMGLVISATSPDKFFVEALELPKSEHPFFIATQAHPEYKTTPWDPHPLFLEFVANAFELSESNS